MIDTESLEFRALKRLCDLCVGLNAAYNVSAMAEELDISQKQAVQVFGILSGHGLVRRSGGFDGYSVSPTRKGYDYVHGAS